jgi:hypothetical protein
MFPLFVEMTLRVKLKKYLLLVVMAEDSASTVFPCALVAFSDSTNIRGIELFALSVSFTRR